MSHQYRIRHGNLFYSKEEFLSIEDAIAQALTIPVAHGADTLSIVEEWDYGFGTLCRNVASFFTNGKVWFKR